jgi:hypothetical protein
MRRLALVLLAVSGAFGADFVGNIDASDAVAACGIETATRH